MKAIETQYAGHRFRSRLEARWAVFFDRLNLDWQYEPEGFELGEAGRYLPDFYLPSLNLWIEVKAQKLSEKERNKAFALSSYTDFPVVELCQIPNPDDILQCKGMPGIRVYRGIGMRDIERHWKMQSLVEFFIEKTGHESALAEHEMVAWALEWDTEYYQQKYGKLHPSNFKNGFIDEGEPFGMFGCSQIYNAAVSARSARFEFGESG